MKLKNTKKPNPNTRLIRVIFRVNAEEMRQILARATAYTDQENVSEWARFAALNYKPRKEDFQK